MGEQIQIALISAGFATLVNCFFQLINRFWDMHNREKQLDKKKAEIFLKKKEAVYIAAIDRLLQIRRGFDYTRETIIHNRKLQEKIDKDNNDYAKIAPKLRLYAPDKIFNQFINLSRFAQYSYVSETEPRLIENSKKSFETSIMILSRLMQDDLGIRKMNDGNDMINCPDCNKVHDVISKCPKCGMTFEQYQIIIQQSLAQAFESNSGDS